MTIDSCKIGNEPQACDTETQHNLNMELWCWQLPEPAKIYWEMQVSIWMNKIRHFDGYWNLLILIKFFFTIPDVSPAPATGCQRAEPIARGQSSQGRAQSQRPPTVSSAVIINIVVTVSIAWRSYGYCYSHHCLLPLRPMLQVLLSVGNQLMMKIGQLLVP